MTCTLVRVQEEKARVLFEYGDLEVLINGNQVTGAQIAPGIVPARLQ